MMLAKPSLLFTLTFVAISLLEMIGDTLSITWLHYGCKPLIMGLLVGYSWQQHRTIGYSAPIRWLMIGMVFALLGDVFLMIREIDLFAPGLGAFLIMQLCYSRAFWLSRKQGQVATSRWPYALFFLLYLSIFLTILYPAFAKNPALQPLWWPVVLYAICLNAMGLLSTQRQRLQGYSWVLVGALLFILSDSLIAINKFLVPIAGSTWLVMSTYAAAQYLIVTATINDEQSAIQLHKPESQYI